MSRARLPLVFLLGALAGAASAQQVPPPPSAVSTPSRPSSPSLPSTAIESGVQAPTERAATTGSSARPSVEIGGSGSAGLAAMGGAGSGAFGASSSFGSGATWGSGGAGTTPLPRTPAPTMYDSSRDRCPPGQADHGSGCRPLRRAMP